MSGHRHANPDLLLRQEVSRKCGQHYLQENSDFPAAFVIIILPIISLLCSQGRMNLPQLSTNKVVYASLDFSVSHSLVSLSHTSSSLSMSKHILDISLVANRERITFV